MQKKLLSALLVLGTMFGANLALAQNQAPQKEKKKYYFKRVENKNGEETVIEKNFESKEEMDAYLKSNGFDMDKGKKIEIKKQSNAGNNFEGLRLETKKGEMKKFENMEEAKNYLREKGIEIDVEGDNVKTSQVFIKKSVNDETMEIEIDGKRLNGAEMNEWKDENGKTMKIIQLDNAETVLLDDNAEVKKSFVFVIRTVKIEEIDNKQLPKNIEKENKATQLSVEQINVYPNPTNGKFKIKFDLENKGDVSLKVLDLKTGEQVFEDAIPNFSGTYEKELNIDKKGEYVLQIFQGGKRITKKLVVS